MLNSSAATLAAAALARSSCRKEISFKIELLHESSISVIAWLNFSTERQARYTRAFLEARTLTVCRPKPEFPPIYRHSLLVYKKVLKRRECLYQ